MRGAGTTQGYYLLPGCAPQNLNYSGGCTWDPNLCKKIQPRSEGLDFTAKYSQQLGDNWQSKLAASFTQIVLPANHPDNPFNPASPYFAGAQAFYGAAFANYIGKAALLYGALTDIPVQITKYQTDVIPRSPADLAGASPGSHLIALNGYKWSKDLLHDTLSSPPDPSGEITLLVQKDDMFKTLTLKYSGGERYPNLVRRPQSEDLLAKIAHPRAAP